MTLSKIAVLSMITACLLLTGCSSDAYLSIENNLGFKAHDTGTKAHTYLKLTAYEWHQGKEGEQVGGPWIWDLPATAGGHTNWANSHLTKRVGLEATPEAGVAVRFKYHVWQNIHSGTQVQTTELYEGWSDIIEPVDTPTTAYVSNLQSEVKDGGFNWWVQCRIRPTRN